MSRQPEKVGTNPELPQRPKFQIFEYLNVLFIGTLWWSIDSTDWLDIKIWFDILIWRHTKLRRWTKSGHPILQKLVYSQLTMSFKTESKSNVFTATALAFKKLAIAEIFRSLLITSPNCQLYAEEWESSHSELTLSFPGSFEKSELPRPGLKFLKYLNVVLTHLVVNRPTELRDLVLNPNITPMQNFVSANQIWHFNPTNLCWLKLNLSF